RGRRTAPVGRAFGAIVVTLWVAVLLACTLSFALKLTGYLLPERALAAPWAQRVTPLLPVALLTALIVTQGMLDDAGALVVDARAAGLAVAMVALVARAPFLLVLVLAAGTAALVRAMGG
ncbi:MAG: AzlD domain-containing protein, partial [Ornithinimicrobium sp.]